MSCDIRLGRGDVNQCERMFRLQNGGELAVDDFKDMVLLNRRLLEEEML